MKTFGLLENITELIIIMSVIWKGFFARESRQSSRILSLSLFAKIRVIRWPTFLSHAKVTEKRVEQRAQ